MARSGYHRSHVACTGAVPVLLIRLDKPMGDRNKVMNG